MNDMITILLVDDDVDLLVLVRMELEEAGSFRVSAFTSADEALKELKKNHYDVIISDLRMEGMEGLEFLEEVHKLQKESIRIIYSGRGLDPDIAAALRGGVDYYLNRAGDPDREFGDLISMVQTGVTRKKTA